ncbi:serine/threonine-protein kinase [Streptomyces sp. XM4193]|uniref:serine/threonine-protein kinase n=1 Tax=Streptomyces sp. XM4193 TaxID=2929782 RepID=UPI001FF70716|nr:serine/threonine-protein kinase [Streptomyces sp. XM4193]MCK1798624.1 serine/threonine-protein kinase [Streptomyces sp. XM4193]
MEPLQPGDPARVGAYRLMGRLGAGGMGRVYLARSAGGRTVAVKVVRPELAEDPGFRERFRREVQIAGAVSGRRTAPVVDADPDAAPPQLPWLATQYVTGPSLAEVIRRHGALPERTVRALGAGLAEALHEIHAAGLVHRDLKPSNVLLAADAPRVIDFGIARAVDGDRLTRTGSLVGSPGFMSPEQAEGRQVGPPADIFSLGTVLCYAATGQNAFGDSSPAALLYQIAHAEPDLSRVPDSLRALLAACLAKDPSVRPSAEQIAEHCLPAQGEREFGDWLPGAVSSTIATLASRILDLEAPPEAPQPGGGGDGVGGPGEPNSSGPASGSGADVVSGAGAGAGASGGPEGGANERTAMLRLPSRAPSEPGSRVPDPRTPAPYRGTRSDAVLPGGAQPPNSGSYQWSSTPGTSSSGGFTGPTNGPATGPTNGTEPVTDAVPDTGPDTETPQSRSASRRRFLLAAAGLAGVVTSAVGGAWLLSGDGSAEGRSGGDDGGPDDGRKPSDTEEFATPPAGVAPAPLWLARLEEGSLAPANPVVVGDVVAVGGMPVRGVHTRTGRETWRRGRSEDSQLSRFHLVGEVAYQGLFGSDGYALTGVDLRTGKETWRTQLPEKLRSPRVVAADRRQLYFYSRQFDGDLGNRDQKQDWGAVDIESGKPAWTVPRDISRSEVGMVALAAGDCLVVCEDERVLTVRSTEDGSELWSRRIEGAVQPVVAGDRLLLHGDELVAHRLRTGEKLWSLSPNGRRGFGVPTAIDDALYLFDFDQGLWKVDPETGNRLAMQESLGGRARGDTVVKVGESLYVASSALGTGITAIDIRTLERRWTYNDGERGGPWYMAVAGRRLIVLHNERLVALPAV